MILLSLSGLPPKTYSISRDNIATTDRCILSDTTLNKTIEIQQQKIEQLPAGQYSIPNTSIKLRLPNDSYVVCTPNRYLIVTTSRALISVLMVNISNSSISLHAPKTLVLKEIQTAGIKLSEPQKLNGTLYFLHNGEFLIDPSNNTLTRSLLRQGILVKFNCGGDSVYLVLYLPRNLDIGKAYSQNTYTKSKTIPSGTRTPSEWVSHITGSQARESGKGESSGTGQLYVIILIASIATLLYYLVAVRKVESSGY
jgi:hypothetical protein